MHCTRRISTEVISFTSTKMTFGAKPHFSLQPSHWENRSGAVAVRRATGGAGPASCQPGGVDIPCPEGATKALPRDSAPNTTFRPTTAGYAKVAHPGHWVGDIHDHAATGPRAHEPPPVSGVNNGDIPAGPGHRQHCEWQQPGLRVYCETGAKAKSPPPRPVVGFRQRDSA